MSSIIPVKALAIPYGVPNGYKETLVPGCLTEFLREWTRAGIGMPMLISHDEDRIAGKWTGFADKPNGLYLKGLINTRAGLEWWRYRRGGFVGVSVTYNVDRRRMKPDVRLMMEDAFRGLRAVTVKRAMLSECSLTTSPAWKQTWVKEIEAVKEAA